MNGGVMTTTRSDSECQIMYVRRCPIFELSSKRALLYRIRAKRKGPERRNNGDSRPQTAFISGAYAERQTVSADVQFVCILVVVVVKPDEFVPLDVVLKTIKEGHLEIGLQRESEFSS